MSNETNTRSSFGDATTIEFSSGRSANHLDSSTSQGLPSVRCPPVEFVTGAGKDWTCEINAVLHRRLKLALWALSLGFGVFLPVHWFLGSTAETMGRSLLVSHGLLTSTLLASALGLTLTRQSLSSGILRLLEVAAFGLTALFFSVLSWATMETQSGSQGHFSFQGGYWLILIYTYALFIPNSFRRAAIVIAAIACLPIALLYAGWLFHPDISRAMTTDHLVVIPLVFATAGLTALLGVDTIHQLHRQTFEANRLGQYHLKKLLGQGGMGEVHLAEHELLKRPCALKLIRPDKLGDPRLIARFEREVRTMARLSHWNTVEIFDYGLSNDGVLYYVMEYLPGLDLGQIVERFGRQPPARVIYILRQVCDALREAHSLGFIHRDIKPGNVFLAQRGGIFDVVKVLDFGLAKPFSHRGDSLNLTLENAVTGSPLYMSPEQVLGEENLDPRTDIYSLGALAYYLLTGYPPFSGEKPIKIMLAHIYEPVEPLRNRVPDLPEDLCSVVLRCLEKDRDRRYADVQELDVALKNCGDSAGWDREKAAAWWATYLPVNEDSQAQVSRVPAEI
ncbi:MAG: serine/threonine protein kinase [Thermogutta sp.]